MFEGAVASSLPMQRVYAFRYEDPSFNKSETPNLPLPNLPLRCELHFALDCCSHDNLVCRTRYRGCTKCVAETHHTNPSVNCYNVQPSSLSFSIPPPSQLARMPSPVKNLMAAVTFDVTKSKIIANLSWIGPESPYGKINYYKSPEFTQGCESYLLDNTGCQGL